MSRPLHEVLCATLDTAVDENGYAELLTERPETVAVYIADHADIDAHQGWRYLHELVPLIKQWQSDRRAKVLEV